MKAILEVSVYCPVCPAGFVMDRIPISPPGCGHLFFFRCTVCGGEWTAPTIELEVRTISKFPVPERLPDPES